jgi:NAD(P)-dependent dehydrogenase (short-subunit alcohol dehydrogenase family)
MWQTSDGRPTAALVTGGARGIGLAIARTLAEEGFVLTLVDRLAPELEAAVAEFAERGFSATAFVADLRDEEAINRAVEHHRSQWGRLDVLVNNAGVSVPTPLGEVTAKRMDLLIDVNLRATVLMTRDCLDLLRIAGREHRRALVVNVASISAKSGVGGLGVYSAVKAGVVALAQALNQEGAPDGVRATALCPASVDTAMTDPVKDRVPADSMMTAQDIAESVRFLVRTSARCVVPEIIFNLPGATTERFE